MRRTILIALAAMALAGAASYAQETTAPAAPTASVTTTAPPEPSDAPVVDMANFCSGMTGHAGYYPSHALENHIGGRALLDCALQADGKPAQCQVVEEAPTGEGFGHTALVIACIFRTNTRATFSNSSFYERDGVRHVRAPITFRLR